jgi:predicted DNA-binding protein (MmcQ/YjbR family)
MARSKKGTDAALEALRAFGLAYPGAHTKSPWPGHLDLAVNDKTFAYLSIPGDPLHISCKLPQSCDAALSLPFTSPTAYGLGKSGWVSATFEAGEAVPIDMLQAWIDESYRAQAPKRLSRGLAPLESSGESTAHALEEGAVSPRQGAVSPRQGAVSPRQGAVSRRQGAVSPRPARARAKAVQKKRKPAAAVSKKAPRLAKKKRARAAR